MAFNLFLANRTNTVDRRNVLLTGILVSLAVVLTTIQDALHSYFNQYSFYLSESLLFKSFWIVFFPVIAFQIFLIARLQLKANRYFLIIGSTLLFTALHCLLFPLLTFILSASFFDHSYKFSGVFQHTISEDLYKYLIIYGVVTTALISNRKIQHFNSIPRIIPTDVPVTRLTVGTGRNNVIINVEDILFINTSNPYTCIYTKKGKFLHGETLKGISEKLDDQQFIRIHKSTIVNIKHIVSYKSRLNGDYDLQIQEGHSLRMSRNYTLLFRRHFG